MQNNIVDNEVVGSKEKFVSPKISRIEELVLQEMKHGMYLAKNNDGQEGLSFSVDGRGIAITNIIKAGTIDKLLQGKYIYESGAIKNKYLLTDKGWNYFKSF